MQRKNRQDPPSREEVYSTLATLYKYTPAECADMTPYQQLKLIDPGSAAKTMDFNSKEEYMEWMARRSQ